jgi:PAS domain S-box-containing protein
MAGHTSVAVTPGEMQGVPGQDLTNEMFRLVVEACPSGMVMFDHSGQIVMVNTELEEQFGYPREELLGRPIELLIPERLRIHHIRDRDIFFRPPETRHMGTGVELHGRRKDGTEFPIEVALNPIRSGLEPLVLGAIVDISQRKRMERLKDEFVATVSHELRTPMTSISGSLGLLIGQWSNNIPESAARLLVIAHNNTQRLVRLINDILDMGKIEAEATVFNFQRINVVHKLEQVIETNRAFADGFNVKLTLDSDAKEIEIATDADRLEQIVTNLLSNAVKFSPAGGEVVISLKRRAGGVRIAVRDWGAGIPEDFKPHVFEKFAQADATDARQKGGTGLGLSIVKQIVDRLGGDVGFDDGPEGGTVFHVELPDWDGGRRRVLHLDDDHSVLALVRTALSPDADVVSVDSLEMAHAALGSNRIDLAILDVALGAASGLDLLPYLYNESGEMIPAIVFSQTSDPDCTGQIRSSLPKSRTSLDDLVEAVRDRLLPQTTRYTKELA